MEQGKAYNADTKIALEVAVLTVRPAWSRALEGGMRCRSNTARGSMLCVAPCHCPAPQHTIPPPPHTHTH
jgi:hypothetical protein